MSLLNKNCQLDAKNLSMSYGATLALDDVSFSLSSGQVVGLLGPNGAGKTTLMRILTTFIYPSKGTAIVGGFDVTRDPLQARQLIGYLPEIPPLYMDMRVDEYIYFVACARGLSGSGFKKRRDWVVDAVKISSVWKHGISELSLGFRQRVGLAQALIHDPEVIILDEPTSGLDPIQIIEIRKLIRQLSREKLIIFSTHILQEASSVADKLMIIDKGKIIASGTQSELRNAMSGDQILEVAIQGQKEEIEAHLKGLAVIKQIRLIDDACHVARFSLMTASYDDAARAIGALAQSKSLFVKEIRPSGGGLEDVFLKLFERAERKK